MADGGRGASTSCFQNSFEGATAMVRGQVWARRQHCRGMHTPDTRWGIAIGITAVNRDNDDRREVSWTISASQHPHLTSLPCQKAIITLDGVSWRILDAFPLWPYWYPLLSCLRPLARRSTWSNFIYHEILNILWEFQGSSFQRLHEWRVLLQITHLRPEPRLLFCIL